MGFKIKFTRFTEYPVLDADDSNTKYKMVLLNLRKDMGSDRDLTIGDKVTKDPQNLAPRHTGKIVELQGVHARVRCEDGRTRYFDLGQLSLKEPNYEDTVILSIVGEDERLAVFNLSDHSRKVQCEANLEIHHPSMADSHVLQGISGFTKQDPYTFIPAVKKLSLAIRTAEHIGADRNRVLESSVNRVQETAALRSR